MSFYLFARSGTETEVEKILNYFVYRVNAQQQNFLELLYHTFLTSNKSLSSN